MLFNYDACIQYSTSHFNQFYTFEISTLKDHDRISRNQLKINNVLFSGTLTENDVLQSIYFILCVLSIIIKMYVRFWL